MKTTHYIKGMAVLVALAMAGCVSGVNETITVEEGGERDGNLSTVNGRVILGDGAHVAGDLSSVNGGIRLGADSSAHAVETVNGGIEFGDGAEAREATTVNGRIRLGEGAKVTGEVTAVNGSISLATDSHVEGTVSNVNGRITLTAARIDGNLITRNGTIELLEGSEVGGDLEVRSTNDDEDRVRVVIGPGSSVAGMIRIERPADVYVHETASFGGIEGAEVIRYSGDEAPE